LNITWINIKSGFTKFGQQSGSRPHTHTHTHTHYFTGQSIRSNIAYYHVFYKMNIVIWISYFQLISAHYCFLKCRSMFAFVIITGQCNGQWLDVHKCNKCFIIIFCSVYNDNNDVYFILTFVLTFFYINSNSIFNSPNYNAIIIILLIYIIFNSPSKEGYIWRRDQSCLYRVSHFN